MEDQKHPDTFGAPIAQIVAVLMLAWALVPSNPYGYNVLLRVVICGISAYLAFQAYEHNRLGWVWALGITAVVYNPLVRIHLTREIWSVVNVVTIGMFVVTIWAIPRSSDEQAD